MPALVDGSGLMGCKQAARTRNNVVEVVRNGCGLAQYHRPWRDDGRQQLDLLLDLCLVCRRHSVADRLGDRRHRRHPPSLHQAPRSGSPRGGATTPRQCPRYCHVSHRCRRQQQQRQRQQWQLRLAPLVEEQPRCLPCLSPAVAVSECPECTARRTFGNDRELNTGAQSATIQFRDRWCAGEKPVGIRKARPNMRN